ncbi:MAG: J domain-containing protein [Acidobacteriota bacterium]|nr:J domain-containing protein [Acidobacteriota bacterium]
MFGSHHNGDISYYEELGLAPDASPEEIRDAFRLNVRLLHPDQHTDPHLKEIAERQMRKLNRIYAVLSDPDSRRQYDESPDVKFVPPLPFDPPLPARQTLRPKLAWASAIVVSGGLLMWLAADNQPGFQGRAPDNVLPAQSAPAMPQPAAPAPQPDQSTVEQIRRLQSDLRAALMERDAAIRELAGLRSPGPGARIADLPPSKAAEPHPAANTAEPASPPRLTFPASPAPLPQVERPQTLNHQLAGFWFYARPPLGQMNKNRALYPPEFIEATLFEENGSVRGRLRARYQITDGAISPEVNFTFAGTQNGTQLACPWTGPGGARGEITLKLTAENFMRIDWAASELGSQQGLSSGTAVLTRRIEQ